MHQLADIDPQRAVRIHPRQRPAGEQHRSQTLQARVERRFNGGLTMNLAYTWSKFMEKLTYLNAGVLSGVNGVVDGIIGGWQLPMPARC